MSKITVQNLRNFIIRLNKVYEENKDYLTSLDAAIGDGDHGINMSRGFNAAAKAVEPCASAAELFRTLSSTLIKTVGGASGPLYGTFYMKLAPVLTEDADTETILKAFTAAGEGIAKLGRCNRGEKTMYDALIPACEAMRKAIDDGAGMDDFLEAAANGAKEGSDNTKDITATKGRASYLGERSVGHIDPGSVSMYLMFKTLHEVMKEAA